MSNEEVTMVAADYMYLVLLGKSRTIEKIAMKLNEDMNMNNRKIYVSVDINTQVDYLPETKIFQNLLRKKNIGSVIIDVDDCLSQSEQDDESYQDLYGSFHSESESIDKKYFMMGEGVETAQCYTCGEGYVDVHMLIEIEEKDNSFVITYPILTLDDEANPDDLIESWIITNDISNIANNLNTRLVNMVGTEHDILVFAAHVNN